jgi:hypothetical protein
MSGLSQIFALATEHRWPATFDASYGGSRMAAESVPDRQRMPCRMVEQYPHVMFRRGQIAGPQRNRTRR